MAGKARAAELRGAARLVTEGVGGVVDVVEAMHTNVARAAAVPDTPVHAATRAVTRLVYGAIRGVTGVVGSGVDGALAVLGPTAVDARSTPARETLLAIVNGVVGDHLVATANPLAIPMRLRQQGRPLPIGPGLREAVPSASRRVIVMVHGLCMSDLQWRRHGHDHGQALAAGLGATVVYLHYNSGLHVSINGRSFAALLEDLVRHWPRRRPQVTIVAHSLGGLVTRSALHHALTDHQAWPGRVRDVVFLGTPHHGAPLERGGNWLEALLGSTRLSEPLGRLARLRSAAITDLRHGNLRDEDWQGRDRFVRAADRRVPVPLPPDIAFYAVAATKAPAARSSRTLPGDGLVPVASALGRHPRRALALRLPRERRRVVYGTSHLGLLSSPEVYALLRDWLA